MAIKYLQATKQEDESYFFKVWLDDTKTEADGTTPDPAFVKEYAFSRLPDGMTEDDYLKVAKYQIQTDADFTLNNKGPTSPTPLNGF